MPSALRLGFRVLGLEFRVRATLGFCKFGLPSLEVLRYEFRRIIVCWSLGWGPLTDGNYLHLPGVLDVVFTVLCWHPHMLCKGSGFGVSV